MTREEAIEIEFKSAVGWASHMPDLEIRRAAAETIDCYVALGMLKFDEPKDAESRAATLFWAERLPGNHILNALDRAGLKIVEK